MKLKTPNKYVSHHRNTSLVFKSPEKQGYVPSQIESKRVGTCGPGALIGEIAMLDPTNSRRLLSGVCSEDCLILLLNTWVFNFLMKEKIKQERERIGQYIYATVPDLHIYYSLGKIIKGAHHLFKPKTMHRGNHVFREDELTHSLYILKQGCVSFYKRIEMRD